MCLCDDTNRCNILSLSVVKANMISYNRSARQASRCHCEGIDTNTCCADCDSPCWRWWQPHHSLPGGLWQPLRGIRSQWVHLMSISWYRWSRSLSNYCRIGVNVLQRFFWWHLNAFKIRRQWWTHSCWLIERHWAAWLYSCGHLVCSLCRW